MKIIPNSKEFNGAIVLERGTSFLAKQIIMHMAILGFFKGVKPLKYSHAERLIWDDFQNQLYTVGSRADGAQDIKVQDYYTKGHKLRVLIPRVPLTDQETDKLWRYQWDIEDYPYQKGNFAAWITFLKTGIWLGREGDKKTYCYELAAKFSKVINRWPKGKDTDKVSIYDIGYEDEWYYLAEP